MRKPSVTLVCFPDSGGVKQFSDALFFEINNKCGDCSAQFVQCNGSRWGRLFSLFNLMARKHVIFTCNHLFIYLFFFFFFGRVSLILHDHKARIGSSVLERANIMLFHLFRWRFSKVIIHQCDDCDSESLLSFGNVFFMKMPPHGVSFDFSSSLTEQKNNVERYALNYPQFSHWVNCDRIKLLCFGRIEEYKNFEWFADVVAGSESLELLIAGSGFVSQDRRESLDRYFNVNLINEYIADDFASVLLNSCDYLVLPYRDITQTGLIDTAGYFKKPVILSNIRPFTMGGYDHFSYFIPIHDSLKCAEALTHLYAPCSSMYKQLSIGSHQHYIDSLRSWNDYVSCLLD